jgi:ribulose-5-phosphate 4-epimerase/fuculose-1-phosphate aldolase
MNKSKEPLIIKNARINLTIALKAANFYSLNEGICNHFSHSLVVNQKKFFLINPQGIHWSEIKPNMLVLIDEFGKNVYKNDIVEPTAFFLHLSIHKICKFRTVFHTHMPYATALCISKNSFSTNCNQSAMRFYGSVKRLQNYNGLILNTKEGVLIAKAIKKNRITFLENHGVIVCGNEISHTFDDLYYLERCCYVQNIAQSAGKKLININNNLAKKVANQIEGERLQSELHFNALKRIIK